MGSIIERIGREGLTRRSFLGVAAGTAALCGLGFSGCGLSEDQPKGDAPQAGEDGGKWITAICWHNCGGRCLNRCYVVDGTVVRQKTDDLHEDSPDFPQQRACARGRSNRHQVFGPDRIKYPMKRKNWQPGGVDVHGELRGIDEWERISWDEAIDMVASEIKRVTDTYGPTAILAWGGQITRTLTLNGGYCTDWGSTSFGTWDASGKCFGAFTARKDLNVNNKERTDQNDRFELRNSELAVLWGENCTWSGAGNPTYYYLAAKRAGTKFVFIDPYYNNTMQALDAEWIPIRPGTDHTMALGMMYTLLTEDDPASNPLIDWDFLNRCTVGFDADHMPEGVAPEENFKSYVLGEYDGMPKTPEWAEKICGVSADTIKDLARRIGTTKKVALQTGYAPARTNNSDSWPQAFMTLGWMCGHVGESGRMTGTSCRYSAANGGPELVVSGSQNVPPVKNESAVTAKINKNELWEAVLTGGKYTTGFEKEETANVKMIYHGGSSALNQVVGAKTGIEAHRAVECVVTQQYTYNTNARYSDIILPACTRWELFGDFGDGDNRKKEVIYYGSKITDPLYESKNDYEIAALIADKLGLDGKLVNPLSVEQRMFNALSTIKVVNEDNTGYGPLLTITKEDFEKYGVEGEAQEGVIPLAQFMEDGCYQVPRKAGDAYTYIAHEAYRKDPEANPQETASGKFEIHCNALKELIHGYGWTEVDAIPSYNKPVEGYEDTFSDWDSQTKGEFPLQFYTIHYPRRGHSNFDNIPWLRNAFPQECIMNASDAKSLGIAENDVVLVTSKHGQTLRHAHVTERMMPGVFTFGEGAWLEIDEATGIDKSGNVNMINGGNPTGQGHAGFNTCIAKVEKSDMKLDPDYTWPARLDLKWEE